MTQKEAKELSLEVWRYLAAHPWVEDKSGIPKQLLRSVVTLKGSCPLCHVLDSMCYLCPLPPCPFPDSLYHRWDLAPSQTARKRAAEEIVRRIEAWEPEEKPV